MNKVRTTITIDRRVLKKARQEGINISSFTEIKLREFLALIRGKGGCCNDSKSTEYLINNVSSTVVKIIVGFFKDE